MFDFIINNYTLFIIVGVVLLLGLFGYMLDRKKYEKYREEILNENGADIVMNASPTANFSADPTPVAQNQESVVADALTAVPDASLENDNTVILEPSQPNTLVLDQSGTDGNANV